MVRGAGGPRRAPVGPHASFDKFGPRVICNLAERDMACFFQFFSVFLALLWCYPTSQRAARELVGGRVIRGRRTGFDKHAGRLCCTLSPLPVKSVTGAA